MQERLRPVCDTAVLLYGGVWVTYDLSSHAILKCVQSGMPDSLQLCLRRRHQHFHLQRRQLCHHFLSYRYTSLSILSWFAFLYQRLWSVAFNPRLHLVYCSSITCRVTRDDTEQKQYPKSSTSPESLWHFSVWYRFRSSPCGFRSVHLVTIQLSTLHIEQ